MSQRDENERSGLLADHQIKTRVREMGMIEPFEPGTVRERRTSQISPTHEKVVSYGCSHYGYDMRVADEFKVFSNARCSMIDPKAFREDTFIETRGDCIIPPNSFVLGRSVEKFRIPRDILAVVIGKSTYARCGIIVNVTPLEPEWVGHVTIEISNTTPLPAKIYANEGIAQVLFFRAMKNCAVSYVDKHGKYQGQGPEVTLPRI